MEKEKDPVEISCVYPAEHFRVIKESLDVFRKMDCYIRSPDMDIKTVREGDKVKVLFVSKGAHELSPVLLCLATAFHVKGFLRGRGIDVEECVGKLGRSSSPQVD